MSEVLNNQNELRNPRPIGRFLLGLEEYEGKDDAFSYAAKFASRPGNFSKYKHKSGKTEQRHDVMIDGRDVSLEFMIDRYAYIWKIVVAAERYQTEHLGAGHVPHGGERYELHCSQPVSKGKYYEYDFQGKAIRECEIEFEGQLQRLQGIIEYLLSSHENQ